MQTLRIFLWGWVALALVAAVAIGACRIAWELQTRQLELAIDLHDAQRLVANTDESLEELLSALRARGASALMVDPAQIAELRAGWPQPVQTASEESIAPLAWSALAQLRRAGWALIWKLPLPEDLSHSDFSAYLKVLGALAPQAYLPLDWGPEPFGSPDVARALRAALGQIDAALVLLEFHDYTPARALYRQGFTHFVRAHTIGAAEQEELGRTASLARFERAAVERGVRLLYLHLPQERVEVALAEVSALSERLRQDGFPLEALPAKPPPGVAWPLVTLLFAGIVALLVLTLGWLWKLPSAALAGSWLVLVGLAFLGLAQDAPLSRQAGALLAATLAPISSFVVLDALGKGRTLRQTGGQYGFIWVAALALGTLLGGLVSAAVLGDASFYMGIYTFRGVKLAFILPIVLILALYGLRQSDHSSWRSLWRRPLRWVHLMLGFSVGSILLFALLRSGNDTLLPISGLEDQTRSLLESLFYARPRFKEFLIGHPALFLWAAWGAPRFHARSWPLLALGLLGPISIVNTYEHLHTPLLLSLTRTAIGLALGLLLGWVLWRAVCWLERRWTAAK